MSQYDAVVERQRQMIEAEKWSKGVKAVGSPSSLKSHGSQGSFNLGSFSGSSVSVRSSIIFFWCIRQVSLDQLI